MKSLYKEILYKKAVAFSAFASELKYHTRDHALTPLSQINMYPSDITSDWEWSYINDKAEKIQVYLEEDHLKEIAGIHISGTYKLKTIDECIFFEELEQLLYYKS